MRYRNFSPPLSLNHGRKVWRPNLAHGYSRVLADIKLLFGKQVESDGKHMETKKDSYIAPIVKNSDS
jgi:hypothetical protein